MGMFDTVVVLDAVLRCPHGHPVSDFQTKSFQDPSMDVHLFDGPRVHRVARRSYADGDDVGSTGGWTATKRCSSADMRRSRSFRRARSCSTRPAPSVRPCSSGAIGRTRGATL